MVRDADKYKAEDEQQRDRIAAKNGLESYAFNMKSTVEDEKLKDKISDDDKKTIIDKCNEVIEWLDKNQVRTSVCLVQSQERDCDCHQKIKGELKREVIVDNWMGTDHTSSTATSLTSDVI